MESDLVQCFRIRSDDPEEEQWYARWISLAIQRARSRAKSGKLGDLQDVQVLFCGKRPWLAYVQANGTFNRVMGAQQPGRRVQVAAEADNGVQPDHTTDYEGDASIGG